MTDTPYSPQNFEVVHKSVEEYLGFLRSYNSDPTEALDARAALARIKAHTEGTRSENAMLRADLAETRDLYDLWRAKANDMEAGLRLIADKTWAPAVGGTETPDSELHEIARRSLLTTTDSGESARLSSTPTEMAMRLRQPLTDSGETPTCPTCGEKDPRVRGFRPEQEWCPDPFHKSADTPSEP